MMTGLMAPVMVMTIGTGVEIVGWSAVKVEAQRAADAAAYAGAMKYYVSGNAQAGAGTAVDIAELNGISSTATRSWTAETQQLAADMITAKAVAGIRVASAKAMQVTVKRTAQTGFTRIFPGNPASMTITATATAEVVSGSGGPQPCLLAIGGYSNGVTTGTDLSETGTANVTLNGCSVVSDAGISMSGAARITATGTYAAGAISVGGAAKIIGGTYANSAQIPDPFAGNANVQAALATLHAGSGSMINIGASTVQTIPPGNYTGFNLSGQAKLILQPGLYTINGNINASGTTNISGTGVTIVTSGSVRMTGTSAGALSAADTSATSGAIPGMLIISNNSGVSSMTGTSMTPYTGVIYMPNASLTYSGTSVTGSSGCTQVIASTISLTGTSTLQSNCTAYGVPTYGSVPSTASIALVQ